MLHTTEKITAKKGKLWKSNRKIRGKCARGEEDGCKKWQAIHKKYRRQARPAGGAEEGEKQGYAGRTTRRWISPSSLKSRMVATARMW